MTASAQRALLKPFAIGLSSRTPDGGDWPAIHIETDMYMWSQRFCYLALDP